MTIKILLTGAGGFIGSHTAELLVERHFKVLAVDNFSTGKMENLAHFRGSIEPLDITDRKGLENAFNRYRPNIVMHLAAQSAITTAWNDPENDADVNIRGTLNLLALSKKYDVRKFVFASTSAVYGNGNLYLASSEGDRTEPNTPYGVSKLASEHYIRMLFPNYIIFRYANVYGPRQTPIGENQVVARAFSHFIHGTDFKVVGHGLQKRDFVYVRDVAYANLHAAIDDVTGTFNVAAGRSYSVSEVLRTIEDYFGVRGYRWEHTDKQDERGSVYLLNKKIRKVMGWQPIMKLSEGIARTAEWWRN